VLGRFRAGERAVIRDAEEKAVQAVVVWVAKGIQACMNQYNVGTAKDPN
jgi:peptidyl-tRNA hydrolase